jgi:ELWxxDGT repeat protein
MKCTVLTLALVCFTLHLGAQAPTLVSDLYPGPKDGNPENLVVYNNRLYFYASDSLRGSELWYVDSNSTLRFAGEVNAGPSNGTSTTWAIGGLSAGYNGKFYYQATPQNHVGYYGIYEYDGVHPPVIAPGCAGFSEDFRNPTVVGNKLYFRDSYRLYSYNGLDTPLNIPLNGYRINQWGANTLSPMVEFRGKLYFAADAGPASVRSELYCFNPIDTSINLVADIFPGYLGSAPSSLSVLGDKLYFAASDDSSYKEHLFSFDGTSVRNLSVSSTNGFGSMGDFMSDFATLNGAIYFKASIVSNSHDALYKYDTANKTVTLVKDIDPGGLPKIYMLYGSPHHIYFMGYTAATGYEVWRSDGTTCSMLADLNPGPADGSGFAPFAYHNGYVYFNGDDGTLGFELYKIGDAPLSAITSASWTGNVVLFPNPATNTATLSISLQTPQSLSITMHDVAGKVVYNSGTISFPSGKTALSIPIQHLSPAQYFYTISGADKKLACGTLIRQ